MRFLFVQLLKHPQLILNCFFYFLRQWQFQKRNTIAIMYTNFLIRIVQIAQHVFNNFKTHVLHILGL